MSARSRLSCRVATGDAIAGCVDGMIDPIHRIHVVAMGMLTADSLQRDLARGCEEEGRFEFMAVVLPLRLPSGTGSLSHPIAIF